MISEELWDSFNLALKLFKLFKMYSYRKELLEIVKKKKSQYYWQQRLWIISLEYLIVISHMHMINVWHQS